MSLYSNQWINFFNWTITYREDSTFFHPYGSIEPIATKPHPSQGPELDAYIQEFGRTNKEKYTQGKIKKVAWFVSNCHSVSGREAFTKELQKYIEVRSSDKKVPVMFV